MPLDELLAARLGLPSLSISSSSSPSARAVAAGDSDSLVVSGSGFDAENAAGAPEPLGSGTSLWAKVIARIDQEASVIAASPGAVEADLPVGAHVALPDGVGDALAMPGTATGTAPTVDSPLGVLAPALQGTVASAASLTPASSAASISDVVSPVRLVISLDLDVASKMQIHAICNLTTCMFFNRSSAVLLCGGHYSVRSCVVLYEVWNDILNTPL